MVAARFAAPGSQRGGLDTSNNNSTGAARLDVETKINSTTAILEVGPFTMTKLKPGGTRRSGSVTL